MENKTIQALQNVYKSLGGNIDNVLNINKNIDLNEHFIFDLGGTSLDYLTLLMKIEEKYDFKFHQNDEACYTVLQFTNYVVNLLK